MARYDFRTPRLYVDAPLNEGAHVVLDAAQAHYLGTVLRLRPDSAVLAFNGRDGEWGARLAAHKRVSSLVIETRTRPQPAPGDLHYAFAPLKGARLDYMVQKAVEMGASRLQAVQTRHSQVPRVNTARMHANAVEAAEQCGILSLPEIAPPVTFAAFIAARDPVRWLVFCDEDAEAASPVAALQRIGRPPLAVLIGPEGGFTDDEREVLLAQPNVVRLSLGPRILRGDTAAVAALTLVQALNGDWQ